MFATCLCRRLIALVAAGAPDCSSSWMSCGFQCPDLQCQHNDSFCGLSKLCFVWVAVRFSEKHTAGSLRLSVQTQHLAVGKLLRGLMLTLIVFSLSLLGSGCTVNDLGFSGMTFLGCALQNTEVLDSC